MTATPDREECDTDLAPPPDPQRFRALAVIDVATFMVVLDASGVLIALPSAPALGHFSSNPPIPPQLLPMPGPLVMFPLVSNRFGFGN